MLFFCFPALSPALGTGSGTEQSLDGDALFERMRAIVKEPRVDLTG